MKLRTRLGFRAKGLPRLFRVPLSSLFGMGSFARQRGRGVPVLERGHDRPRKTEKVSLKFSESIRVVLG